MMMPLDVRRSQAIASDRDEPPAIEAVNDDIQSFGWVLCTS
jgi:hypothetical protein